MSCIVNYVLLSRWTLQSKTPRHYPDHQVVIPQHDLFEVIHRPHHPRLLPPGLPLILRPPTLQDHLYPSPPLPRNPTNTYYSALPFPWPKSISAMGLPSPHPLHPVLHSPMQSPYMLSSALSGSWDGTYWILPTLLHAGLSWQPPPSPHTKAGAPFIPL